MSARKRADASGHRIDLTAAGYRKGKRKTARSRAWMGWHAFRIIAPANPRTNVPCLRGRHLRLRGSSQRGCDES